MESLSDPIVLKSVKAGLVIGFAICVVAVIALVFIAIIASQRRGAKYRQISTEGAYNLRYCSAKRFMGWLKFFPWEGVGVLRLQDQLLVFDAIPNSGGTFTVRAPVERLLFHGRRNWFRNGLLPWLLLKSDSGDYYLCVETGPTILGAGRMTRDLLATIRKQAELGEGGKASPATS
jgi:hypothetical protein